MFRIALLTTHVSKDRGPSAGLWQLPQVELDRYWRVETLLKALKLERYDLVVIELPWHEMDQANSLTQLTTSQTPPMILLTDREDLAGAIALSNHASHHFHPAHEDPHALLAALKQHGDTNTELAKSAHAMFARRYASEDFLVRSTQMHDVLDLAQQAAPGPSTVLITGESGTGKEKLAKFVHTHSARASAPFVAVNCAALAPGVLESELFGHVKGAFTGAQHHHTGLFRRAHGGTLFLDEIGEVDISFQAKLLRVLQEREVQPVGANEAVPIDVRIIAATNQNLLNHPTFRQDLYYRLAVIPLNIPPLRHRRDEILPLAKLFLKKMNQRLNKSLEGFSEDVERFLQNYQWPGNVRELENLIERGCALERSNTVRLHALQLPTTSTAPTTSTTLAEAIDQTTIRCIQDALDQHDGHRTKAAEALGVERTTLYRLMKKHHMD